MEGAEGKTWTSARGPRVFLGLHEVAGYCDGLQRGFRELGVRCTYVTFSAHPFKYSARNDLPWVIGLFCGLVRFARHRVHRGGIRGLVWRLIWLVWQLPVLLWATAFHDVFIFTYGQSFLRNCDLPLLRLCRRKIIFVYFGSDSRPPYLDGAVQLCTPAPSVEELLLRTERQKRSIRRTERYADVVINNPLGGHFHQRPFVSWFQVGFPIRPLPATPVACDAGGHSTPGAVRILHAPSHPLAKGTPQICEAIENLRGRGHEIDFIEVTGRPNCEVLEELARCDFVIDQVYCDTPMAGFAAEAALLGKPAVVGGYGGPQFARWIPASLMPPTLYCHPDALEASIERLIVDVQYRRQLGRDARNFAIREWAPTAVAGRFLRLIDGGCSVSRIVDPREIDYTHGFGLSENRARTLLRAFLAAGGPSALCLDDKPALREQLCSLAEMKSEAATAPLGVR